MHCSTVGQVPFRWRYQPACTYLLYLVLYQVHSDNGNYLPRYFFAKMQKRGKFCIRSSRRGSRLGIRSIYMVYKVPRNEISNDHLLISDQY